jgi:hypothetical protein
VTNPRIKPLILAAIAVVAVWAVSVIGYRLATGAKMTPEKLAAALRETDLNKLRAEERARRLQELADKFNALQRDDRRAARRDAAWDRLWSDMTEQERSEFVERTMPGGFRQMISAFEQMPEEKRRAAITNTLARLQRAREGEGAMDDGDPNRPAMSEELQKKVITTGLQTFYAESSAQTKAELAPVLEEMQRLMENGQLFRRR